MRHLMGLLPIAVLAGVVAGCSSGSGEDTQARAEIQAIKTWHVQIHAWHERVAAAVCQLEVDVYDVQNSAGDTRAVGPPANPGSNRLCPNGPGDPIGAPPPPPGL